MVDFADCVEAHVIAISVMEQTKSVRISLRSPSSILFAIVVDGVDQLMIEEFRFRNIVDRVHVWSSANAPEQYRDCLKALVAGKSEGRVSEFWRTRVEDETRSIQSGQRILVEIEPVYGAWIMILGQKIELVAESARTADGESADGC